jgi:hypothetical protein
MVKATFRATNDSELVIGFKLRFDNKFGKLDKQMV